MAGYPTYAAERPQRTPNQGTGRSTLFIPGECPTTRIARWSFTTVAEVEKALQAESYLPDHGLATAIYLALAMRRPLLLEGEPGVGKTEVAKTLARILDAELIRLQCYEGIDASQALYEWDYSRQLLYARALQGGELDPKERVHELYGPEFLLERPLLKAIRAGAARRAADRRARPRRTTSSRRSCSRCSPTSRSPSRSSGRSHSDEARRR